MLIVRSTLRGSSVKWSVTEMTVDGNKRWYRAGKLYDTQEEAEAEFERRTGRKWIRRERK